MYAVRISPSRFLMRQTIVVPRRRLMRKVLQAIPLRPRLCVDVDLVIHGLEAQRRIQVNLLLCELFAAEARELDVVEGPVELEVFAGLDLVACGLDDGGREDVDHCVRCQ